MVVSARDVAAALRERLPGLSQTKEHKLLYYCQGHHLATFGEPLFRETVSAWDLGPVVGEFWHTENQGGVAGSSDALDEAQLNTVGYVVSRYAKLTATEPRQTYPCRRSLADRKPEPAAKDERAHQKRMDAGLLPRERSR